MVILWKSCTRDQEASTSTTRFGHASYSIPQFNLSRQCKSFSAALFLQFLLVYDVDLFFPQLTRIIKKFPQVGQMGSPLDAASRTAELEERAEEVKADPLLGNTHKLYPFTKPGLAYLKKTPTRRAAAQQIKRPGDE